MQTEYETRTVAVAVGPKEVGMHDETITRIELDDQGAGEYVVLSKPGDDDGKVRICPDEWPALRAAIDRMLGECRD